MNGCFGTKILVYLVLTEAISLTSDVDMYISIQIVHKSLF